MKKIRKYGIILFAGLCACAAWSCEEDKTDRKFTPKDPVIKLGGDVEVGKAGGSYTVPIESNLPWRVRSEADWILLGEVENGMGDGEFTFTVSPNKTLFEREGRVTAWITDEYAQSIRVVQAPSSPEDLEVHWYVKTDGSADNDGMTWETATTLHNALSKSINGNFIHVAAGTYVPEQSLAGSKGAAEDATFEISANVSLIGGYPADAVTGAVADPDANPTVLSGRLSGGRHAYHVVCVTAAKADGRRVLMKGLTITEGLCSGTASYYTLNGARFYISRGGGVTVGNAAVDIADCKITQNKSAKDCAGICIVAGADVSLTDTEISENECSNGNGAGLHNEASVVRMDRCTVRGNSASGVCGGVYTFSSSAPSYTYIYNSTLCDNRTDGSKNSRRGGAVYSREYSETVLVNCTVHGNTGGNGGGIALYGASGKESKMTLVSCTVTGNTSLFVGGGVEFTPYTTMNVYNTVVSGNTAANGGDDLVGTNTALAATANLPAVLSYAVNGSVVYGAGKAVVAGSSFDPATMLGPLAGNGGPTQTCLLLGGGQSRPDAGHALCRFVGAWAGFRSADRPRNHGLRPDGAFARGNLGDGSLREVTRRTEGGRISVGRSSARYSAALFCGAPSARSPGCGLPFAGGPFPGDFRVRICLFFRILSHFLVFSYLYYRFCPAGRFQ